MNDPTADRAAKNSADAARPPATSSDGLGETLPFAGHSSDVDMTFGNVTSSNETQGGEPPATEQIRAPGDSASQYSPTLANPTGVEQALNHIRGEVKRKTSTVFRTRVGDYEVERELGRGGMGVVYKARHKQLRRDVALKMILAGGHAGPEQLERFLAEARAVAQLQHPNIVQIFDIGEHDGLPYFSLEYVDGGSFAQMLNKQPQPPEEAGQMVELLARAMQYAHDHGVLHRDLKPANVLVTKEGVPKITDFGLAKKVDDDESASTRTGTVMGTPSYMSPEQALGQTHEIGPAADQYSLGALLYEMLTGRPPFLAAKAVDTILQVINNEPIPPRQLQPSVPVDLETICLKALQKEPGKRYASCLELAEDARRFREGAPILARPVGNVERLTRWCRRNPRLALWISAAVILLLLTAVISTGSAIVVSSKNTALEQASLRIQEEAENAKRQEAIAKQKALDEEAARKSADENATIAGQQATLALGALQTLVDQVQRLIGDSPGTQELKRNLLATAIEGLEKVAASADKSTSKEATMAAAHNQMGRLFQQLGESDKAYEQFQKCHAIVQERVKIKEGSDASRANLATSCSSMAQISQDLRRDMQASLRFYQQSLELYRDIDEHPKPGEGHLEPYRIRLALSEAETRVGATILRLGNPVKAMEHFKRALEIREVLEKTIEQDPDFVKLEAARQQALRYDLGNSLAKSYLAMGNLLFRIGRFTDAQPYYRRTMELRESLAVKFPKILSAKSELGRVAGMMGEFLLQSGETDAARPYFKQAITIGEELMQLDSKLVEYRRDVSLAHYRMGQWQKRKGEESRESFEKARAIRAELAATDASNERRRMEWMLTLAQCGSHQEAARIANELRQSKSADSELLMNVARCFAVCYGNVASTDPELARTYQAHAIETLRSAIELGFEDWIYLQVEADFDSIKSLPEFVALRPEKSA